MHDLDLDSKPVILAFNKVDARASEGPPLPPGSFAVSAKTGEGLEALRAALAERLFAEPAAR